MLSQDRKLVYSLVVILAVVAGLLGFQSLTAGIEQSFQKCPEINFEKQNTNGQKADSRSRITPINSPEATDNSAAPSENHQDCTEDPALAKYTYELARYTKGLLFATVLTFAIGLGQFIFLSRADKTARMGIGVAARQTVIARRQMLIQGRQTDIQIAQQQIQRMETFARLRPRLRIRHIVPRLQDGEPISVHCVVTNVGETNAFLEAHEVILYVVPISVPPLQDRIWFISHDLIGGQSELFLTERPTGFKYEAGWQLDQPHGGDMFLRGTFMYKDDGGVQRRMGFFRKYNKTTGRFDLIEPGEDEYED